MKKKECALWNPSCCTECVADFANIVPVAQPEARITAENVTRTAKSLPEAGKDHSSSFAGLLLGGLEMLNGETANADDEAGQALPRRSTGWAQIMEPPAAPLLEDADSTCCSDEFEFEPSGEEQDKVEAAAPWISAPIILEDQVNPLTFETINLSRPRFERLEADQVSTVESGLELRLGGEAGARIDLSAPGPTLPPSAETGVLTHTQRTTPNQSPAVSMPEPLRPDGASADAKWPIAPTHPLAVGHLHEGRNASHGGAGLGPPSQTLAEFSSDAASTAEVVPGAQPRAAGPAVVEGTLLNTGPLASAPDPLLSSISRRSAALPAGREAGATSALRAAVAPGSTLQWTGASELSRTGAERDGGLPDTTGTAAAHGVVSKPLAATTTVSFLRTSTEVSAPAVGEEASPSRPAARPDRGDEPRPHASGREQGRFSPPDTENGQDGGSSREIEMAPHGSPTLAPARDRAASGGPTQNAVKSPESKLPAYEFALPAQPAEQPRTQTSLRELTLRVDSGGGNHVDMQFVESGGAVNFKLRTPDPWMAESLRGGIPQLEAELEARGWRADFRPAAAAGRTTAEVEPADRSGRMNALSARGAEAFDGSGQQRMGSGTDSGSQRQRKEWGVDEQEMRELAALRRLTAKGGVR